MQITIDPNTVGKAMVGRGQKELEPREAQAVRAGLRLLIERHGSNAEVGRRLGLHVGKPKGFTGQAITLALTTNSPSLLMAKAVAQELGFGDDYPAFLRGEPTSAAERDSDPYRRVLADAERLYGPDHKITAWFRVSQAKVPAHVLAQGPAGIERFYRAALVDLERQAHTLPDSPAELREGEEFVELPEDPPHRIHKARR